LIIGAIVFALMLAIIWSNYKLARMPMQDRRISAYSFS
jgi:hypothetical protein